METRIIDLKSAMAMNNHYFTKNLKECFDILNKFLKSKSEVAHEPLFVEEKGNIVRLGYKPITKGKTHFYSDETIDNSFGVMERAIMVGFVVFEGCKEYGCYKDVPMSGAPEKNQDSFFKFQFENIEYVCELWAKR